MFGKKEPSDHDLSIKQHHPDNSSNSLVSNTHHTEIPLQSLSCTHIHASNNKNKVHEIEHDPLPPPVDYSGVTPTTRYQFRALGRRALSYHRRKRITNIICLVIWPIMMVVICLALSSTGQQDKAKNYREAYCTNEADPVTSAYIESIDMLAKMDSQNRIHSAYYPIGFMGTSNDVKYARPSSCVRWFGQTYPNKAPYENVTAADRAMPDTYYMPPPPGGWFNIKELYDEWHKAWYIAHPDGVNTGNPFVYQRNPMNQTVYYIAANPDIFRALGQPANVSRPFTSKDWPPTNASTIYADPQNVTAAVDGLLGAIPVRYAFEQDRGPPRPPTLSPAPGEVDDNRKNKIYYAQTFVKFDDTASLKVQLEETIGRQSNSRLSANVRDRIFGAIYFNNIDFDKQHLEMTMQYGSYLDSRHMEGSGIRQMVTITQMTSSLVKIKHAGKYIITQGIRALPFEFDRNVMNGSKLSVTSMYLFPFALSFLLPTFVAILVQEKEDRHRAMMAMNGLKSSAYYLGHYVEFMTMQLIVSLCFCFACAAISSPMVTRTEPSILVVTLLIWSHTQATFAFLLATFFSQTRKAILAVYFFVAVSAILGGIADMIFQTGVPFVWHIHPSLAFFRIITICLRNASRVNGLVPLHWAMFAPDQPILFSCFMILLGESIFFLLLTFYLDAILPSEYGVQRPWHFPVSGFFTRGSKKERDPEESSARHHHSSNVAAKNDVVLEGADADVYAERDRVQNLYDPAKTPLIIDNMYHRYNGKAEPALRGMSFGVETNTVLGLLGPNGAGKSTLIHLLTGLYRPTSGTAFVAGANIRTEMSMVHAKIGVCPQHDILWEDLTVADHLLFYARLRGIPPRLEQQAVNHAIASVSLTKFRDREIKGLSGGERRRVSIAISLLGDNAVVFLDEPTTGLDAAVRRVIWNIINRVKLNRTIVLTTHSMEEADILSDKIAIMNSGHLRCIGTSLHLKELYGSGFRLSISSKPDRLQQASKAIEQNLMRGWKFRRVDKFTNATTFEFELSQPGDLSRLFGELSSSSTSSLYDDVEDWGISQTTLEDVFIKIITAGESALALPDVVRE
ncbi:hypothetical protein BG004_000386 [Podila humilis]|nr:hypothetical protein BG004_000386 [Podila humilis]